MNTKENKLINYLSFSDEVRTALAEKKPILALESTVITHGLPHPINIDVANQLEQLTRTFNVIPATIAILQGTIKIGLTSDEMSRLASSDATKASVRDLAYVVSQKQSAGTTVALTASLAHLAGIRVFATGGIGGAHRGNDWDISADLLEISRTPITIVSAGPKAILDIPRTLEILETYGVPVIGYKTTKIPAFYSHTSDYPAPCSIDSVEALVSYINTHQALQLPSGILIMNPVPKEDEIPAETILPIIKLAIETAARNHIQGKNMTPFLLAELNKQTSGASLKTNISLLKHNVNLGANIAKLC